MPANYDSWKTTEPEREPAKPNVYRCLECDWRGIGAHAFDHHRIDHHRLMLPNGLEAIFSCCDHEATGMSLVERKAIRVISPQPRPRPRLLDKRAAKADVTDTDRKERAKCHARSGGRCEVMTVEEFRIPGVAKALGRFLRCDRRATENHHLIGGIGRRNRGRSILAAHRLDVCQRCHEEITGKVLVPVDGTKREDAASVRYERVR